MTRVRAPKGEGSLGRQHGPHCDRSTDASGQPTCRCGWRYRVTVTAVDGVRVQKTVYAPTQAEVLRKKKKLLAQEAAGTLIAGKPLTVEEWLASWLDSADIKLNTRKGYESKIKCHIIPHLGHRRLDRLEPAQVRAMYVAMRKQGRAEASVRQVHAILHRALKVAVREGAAPRNVCDMIDPPKTVTTRRLGLTLEGAQRVLAVAGDDPRFWVALMCGLRQGEALALRWGDVYLDADPMPPHLVVRRSVSWKSGRDGGGPVFGTPKSAASTNRIVPLLTPVAARLTVAKAKAAANGRAGDDDLVFPGVNGQPLQPHHDWLKWKLTLQMAGVGHVALHAARNTTAQLLQNAGAKNTQAAAILGHSKVDMTQVYIEGNVVAAVDGMKALEAYMAAAYEPLI